MSTRGVLAQPASCATTRSGNNILLVNLAASRVSLGDCQGALAAIEPAVWMRWRYPGLYDLQGTCLIKLRRFAEARRALSQSLDITPVDGSVYAMLYALARREGSETEANRYHGLYEKRCQELGMSEAQGRAGLERRLAEVGVASAGGP